MVVGHTRSVYSIYMNAINKLLIAIALPIVWFVSTSITSIVLTIVWDYCVMDIKLGADFFFGMITVMYILFTPFFIMGLRAYKKLQLSGSSI